MPDGDGEKPLDVHNAWKVEELRKKLIYTFLMLVLFRLVGVIPVSGINAAVVKEVAGNYDMLGLVNMMTGNSFSQMTIMAMGITPYINSSIIMQLLTVAIPALERLQKDGGEEGRKKIASITRYVTVGLALIMTDAWARYMHFVEAGGSKTFAGLCRDSGIRLPYEPGCIRAIGEEISQWLNKNK